MFDDRRFAALLFDMDGTLLTSIDATERVWIRWAERHGLDVPRFLPTIHGRRANDTIASLALPGLDVAAETEAIFEGEMADTDGIEAAPGVAAFLDALPADRWAVVTSARSRLAERRMEAAGLRLPRVVIGAEDVENGKPAPDGFRLAAERLGVRAEDCLVFEDSAAGVDAAEAAGAAALVVTGFQNHSLATRHPSVTDYLRLRVVVDREQRMGIESLD